MSWVFSRRCQQALRENKIKVSIPKQVRVRLFYTLSNFNEGWNEQNESGFNYYTSFFDELEKQLKSEHGLDNLLAYPESEGGSPVTTNLEGFVLRGNYPPFLLDALELFYTALPGERDVSFQKQINEVMEENSLPWRMADGKIFPVDSTYIEEEITRKAYELLNETKFFGALQEFEKARTDLINDDCGGAIQNANLAVESTIKGILKIENAKPGELFRKIIESGYIPEYYSGFLEMFEENTLRCVAIMRNKELGAGHG